MFIISKDEEQWWTAKNMVGQTGQIPVPYIQKVTQTAINRFMNNFFSYIFSLKIIIKTHWKDQVPVVE